LNPDHSPQISGNFFITGGINHFLPLPILGNWLKWLGEKLSVKKTNVPEATGTIAVDWINGAYLMVKKARLKETGLLDEDFFLFAEEIEWCSRLRKKGQLLIYGNCRVIHLQGESANDTFGSSGKGYYNLSDRKGRQIMISNFVRIRKQFGALWFLIHLAVYTVDIPFFLLAVLLAKNGPSFTRLRGFCSNLFYVYGKSLIILRNKEYFYKAL
jgi:GT2 family glycosyltransferase